jgi:hypothetical protein
MWFGLPLAGSNARGTHLQAEEHDCSYDYRSEGKKKLEAANPRIAFQKIGDL